MSRLLVISPRSALSVGLSTSRWEVTAVSSPDVDSWLKHVDGQDALVIETADPDSGRDLLGTIRGRGVTLPTLVVAGDSGGREAADGWPAGSKLLRLPVSRPALLVALDELLTPARAVVPSQQARASAPHWDPPPPPPPTAPQADPSVPHLVERLIQAAPSLPALTEVAEVVLAEALDRTQAEKGALLLQDGERWRVAAGQGLRLLERRFELDGDSWAIEEVVHRGHGVIVDDSDIARQRLRGVPLASSQNLLLAPIPRVDALVVLASDGAVFTEAALIALLTLAEEGGELLFGALQVRELARLLAPYADADG